jgi:hypothetical protein
MIFLKTQYAITRNSAVYPETCSILSGTRSGIRRPVVRQTISERKIAMKKKYSAGENIL